MLAALIIIPCFIATVLMTWMIWNDYIVDAYKWTIVFPLALGTGAFVIRRGLQEWWYSKRPPGLAQPEKDILDRFSTYYRQLDPENKKRFEQRVALFRIQKVFQMRGADKIPGDVQLLMAASAVQLTFGLPQGKELLPKLGTIVMFPQTFITPDYNERLHAIELNQDPKAFNCLILAINMFIGGLQDPTQYYNTGIYGFAQALRLELGIQDQDIPGDDHKILLTKLHVLRHNFPIAYIFFYLGEDKFEIFELCVEFFFTLPEVMRRELPEVYAYLMKILNQDPANAGSPVIAQGE